MPDFATYDMATMGEMGELDGVFGAWIFAEK